MPRAGLPATRWVRTVSAPVHDPTGRDHGHVELVDERGNERDQADGRGVGGE
jgi:hypothetical protein